MKVSGILVLYLNLVIIGGFSSCGKQGETSSADLEVSFGALVTASSLTGGMYMEAKTKGYEELEKLQAPYQKDFLNGIWQFNLLGYQGSFPLTGTRVCGTTEAVLTGGEVKVPLSLTAPTCSSAKFISLHNQLIKKYLGGSPGDSLSYGAIGAGTPARNIEVDSAGNFYIAGNFDGDFSIGSEAFTHVAGSDIYLAKFDKEKNILWKKIYSGPDNDSVLDIAVDSSDNVYIAGYAGGASLDLGGGGFTCGGTNGADQGAFYVKLDSDGNHIHSNCYDPTSTTGRATFNAIAIDSSHNIYLGGNSVQQVDFGGGFIGASLATKSDPVLVKLDSSGTFVWHKEINTFNTNDAIYSIGIDSSDNVIVAGDFSDDFNFGGGMVLTNGPTAFVLKMDSSGSYIWENTYGGSDGTAGNYEQIKKLAIDSNDNIIFGGNIDESVDFGGGTFINPDDSDEDAFIVKVDSDGVHQWSKHISSIDREFIASIGVTENDNVVVSGQSFFSGTISFDTDDFSSLGQRDIFVVKYAPNGEEYFMRQGGGSLDDMLIDSVILSEKEVMFVGQFKSSDFSFGGANLPVIGTGFNGLIFKLK